MFWSKQLRYGKSPFQDVRRPWYRWQHLVLHSMNPGDSKSEVLLDLKSADGQYSSVKSSLQKWKWRLEGPQGTRANYHEESPWISPSFKSVALSMGQYCGGGIQFMFGRIRRVKSSEAFLWTEGPALGAFLIAVSKPTNVTEFRKKSRQCSINWRPVFFQTNQSKGLRYQANHYKRTVYW